MISVQRGVDAFLVFLEKLKGKRIVKERFRPSELIAHLTGYSVSGYDIRLYCQPKYYVREYLWWFVPNKSYASYRVFSVVSNDAPLALKQACELETDFPAMAHDLASNAVQKETAVQAYLDLLIERIRQDFPNAQVA